MIIDMTGLERIREETCKSDLYNSRKKKCITILKLNIKSIRKVLMKA